MRDPLDILAEDQPLGILARRVNLPCCSLIAALELEMAGRSPRGRSLDGYASLDPAFWQAANIVDPADPWSSLSASGSWVSYVYDVSRENPAPRIRSGMWTKVQRWKGLDLGTTNAADDDRYRTGAKGHTYLVRLNASGSVTIIQSGVKRGLRITTGGSWTGTAGLDGQSVGVLELEAE
jgi:hypothetical protein